MTARLSLVSGSGVIAGASPVAVPVVPPALGVDPAAGSSSPAAAVLVAAPGSASSLLPWPLVVLAWWVWTPVAGGLRVRSVVPGEGAIEDVVDDQFLVAQSIALGLPASGVRLVVEGLFEAPRRGSRRPGVGLRVSDGALELVSGLGGRVVGRPLRPRADAWRRTDPPGWRQLVLGLPPKMPAERAEEAAVGEASRRLVWPSPSPFARSGDRVQLTRAEEGAVAEAAFIACVAFLPDADRRGT